MKGRKFDALDHVLPGESKEFLESQRVEVEASLRVADLLHSVQEERQMTARQLAQTLGVTPGYISRLLSGDENPTVRSLARIFHKLGKKYIQEIERNTRAFDVLVGGKPQSARYEVSFSEKNDLGQWRTSVNPKPRRIA